MAYRLISAFPAFSRLFPLRGEEVFFAKGETYETDGTDMDGVVRFTCAYRLISLRAGEVFL